MGPYTTIPRWLLIDREKFVRGKRVCVLVFDNYFSISRTITPVNVRDVDRRLQAIHSRSQVHQFDVKQFAAHSLENNEKLQRFMQATSADEKQYPLFQITQPDASIRLDALTIPDKLFVDEPTWLLVELCLSNSEFEFCSVQLKYFLRLKNCCVNTGTITNAKCCKSFLLIHLYFTR